MPDDPTFLQQKGAVAMGINVFMTPPEQQDDLIAALGAISDAADHDELPKNVGSAFHRALDAPIIVNYVQYLGRSGGRQTTGNARALVDRTHALSTSHEMRWYETVDLVTPSGSESQYRIAVSDNNIGIVSVYTVEPDKRSALLEALSRYASVIRPLAGFKGMAIHRGYLPGHAASYETWTSEAAYRSASAGPAQDALEHVRALASNALIQPCEVVRINRHRGADVLEAALATAETI